MSRRTAGGRASGREQYSWDAVATAYEQLLLEVGEGTGHGPLPLDRLEEIERATGAALKG